MNDDGWQRHRKSGYSSVPKSARVEVCSMSDKPQTTELPPLESGFPTAYDAARYLERRAFHVRTMTTLLNGWLYSGAMTGDQLDKLRADTEKVLQNVE